jgi:transcriptional regulator with XRE-family HTH domain
MKRTIEYLDEAKEALGLTSDYSLAKWLNVKQNTVSQYRTGARVIDDYAAARIAEALKIDPLEVIAAANYEREKDEGRKTFWEHFSQHRMVAGVALALLCGSLLWGGFAENFSADSVFLVGSIASATGEGKPFPFNYLSIMRNLILGLLLGLLLSGPHRQGKLFRFPA